MKLVANLRENELQSLLGRFGIEIKSVGDGDEIPGSYWGVPEAGIIKNELFIRGDTPVHSALHESCHYICMDDSRRQVLDTDTGGDYDEENAVCYLQIILSSYLTDVGSDSGCQDMDDWGYTFRLGSAKKWFEEDADDAFCWLVDRNLLSRTKTPTWKINF